MKRYRPYCAGFIVLYVLTLLSLGDVVYTIVREARGVDDALSGFSFFSYIIFAMALLYTWYYARAKVVIDGTKLRVAFPANMRPKQGQGRAMFLLRQGELDLRFVDKTLDLKKLTCYGYAEDLGYERIDQSQGDEKTRLFPIHEVVLITGENKRYHMNAAVYSRKQQREIFTRIREITGVEPTGSLSEILK